MGLLDILNAGDFPAQDYIELGGMTSPGRATIVNAGSPRTWDKRKGYGFSGATLVYTGDDLAEFDVLIDLWDKSQFQAWDDFAKKTLEKPPIGQRPKALDIKHPILNRSPTKITSVVVLDVLGPDQDEDGLWTYRIKFSAYRAPKPALGKPNASIPSVTPKVPTAQDEAEKKIQALLAQQKALGGAL